MRVILMSATINTDLYRDYFSQRDNGTFGTMKCLSVGAKRFPVEIKYVKDLLKGTKGEGTTDVLKYAQKVLNEDILKSAWVNAQHNLVVALLRTVCKAGSTVLVFISGMDDILSIAALLEMNPEFLVCPMHSTTPEEEQDLIFEPTPPGNIKVVLATNMAESSVTIPECDVVICLGTHKALTFDDSMERTKLSFGLISKASATQRAGRTGRVGPGRVYRLYTEQTHARMMEHELAEVLRRPLEDVVLNMWSVLENASDFQGVTPFLQRMIEVPDDTYIAKSYERLYESALISVPNDKACLTPAGRFTAALPLDLSLGRMLSFGVLLGVPAEAVVMAAAMSLSRSPYQVANPIFLDPEEFNEQVRKRFQSEMGLDKRDYSEPIALLRLLLQWRKLPSDKARHGFCHRKALQFNLMEQFNYAAESLATELVRVQTQNTGTSVTSVDIDAIGVLSASTINILRLIMVWSFSDNLLQLQSAPQIVSKLIEGNTTIQLKSNRVTEEHLRSLFGSIPYSLLNTHASSTSAGSYSCTYPIPSYEPDDYSHQLRLVDSLAKVARFHPTNCVGLVMETFEPEIFQIVFVVLPDNKQHTLVELFHRTVLSETRVENEDRLAQRMVRDGRHIGGAVVCTCVDASQAEVQRLYKLLYSFVDALTMTVPVDKCACISSVKTVLTTSELALVFDLDLCTETISGQTLLMQTLKNTKTLCFPSDVKEDNVISLIQDLSLGHRLVQCCRAARKSDSLVVKLHSTAKAAAESADSNFDAPRSVKRPEKCAHFDVPVHVHAPSWCCLSRTGNVVNDGSTASGFSVLPAKLSRQSMLAGSFHCGLEPLYAVAHSFLPITTLSRTSVMTSGVSFLPTDPAWLQLALRATGKDRAWSNLWDTDKQVKTQRELDLAHSIYHALQETKEFVRRDDIIVQVNALFEPYISGNGRGSSGDVDNF